MSVKYGRQGAVELIGETTVGDGYSMFFDKESGKLVSITEYDSESAGYVTALTNVGVMLEVIRLDEGDFGWEEISEWFEEIRYEDLDVILEACETKGVTVYRSNP